MRYSFFPSFKMPHTVDPLPPNIVDLQHFVNQLSDSLLGFDSNGKATIIQAGTNVTISGGVISATGGGGGGGTVTSVGLTAPTGLTVSGSPITTSGTLALSLTSGYSIPTTTSQTNWDTAFGWGDHSTAGYLTTVDLTTDVTGVLPIANGGTNISTYTTGDILYASATNTLSKLAVGTNGHVLTLSGGVPTWATPVGTTSPGGSDTQLQFNNAGAFGGISTFTHSGGTVTIGSGGGLTLNGANITTTNAVNYIEAGNTGGLRLRAGGLTISGSNNGIRYSAGFSEYVDGHVFTTDSNAVFGSTSNSALITATAAFAPTSGTSQHSIINVISQINQTGGANGITRGLYINPTLTAAADWRAIETSNTSGYSIYTASAPSYFGGNVGISTTSPSAQLSVVKDNIGVTQNNAYGIVLANNTEAAAGAQQMSPGLRFRGNGWKTNATAESQPVDVMMELVPIQSSSIPLFYFNIKYSRNSGSYINMLSISQDDAWFRLPLKFGVGQTLYFGSSINNTSMSDNGKSGLLQTTIGTTTNTYGFSHYERGTTAISGEGGNTTFISIFNPSSGNATYNVAALYPTINQTTGANGITRGLYINPTLTAAADWRAIETTQGTVRLADTYVAGSGSLAGSLLNMTQTWNTTGAPTAIKLDVTNTASGASAKLMDLQIGGTSQFNVTKAGAVVATGSIVGATLSATGAIFAGSGSNLGWSSRSVMFSSADGYITMSNAAATDFTMLRFGGTTSSFPGLKRSTATLQVRLADDSGYADVTAARVISDDVVRLKGYTVAGLPGGTVGDTAYVTDATAPTYLGALIGGGAVVCPVFYNGSAWVSC